jgi:hypothetical protein
MEFWDFGHATTIPICIQIGFFFETFLVDWKFKGLSIAAESAQTTKFCQNLLKDN